MTNAELAKKLVALEKKLDALSGRMGGDAMPATVERRDAILVSQLDELKKKARMFDILLNNAHKTFCPHEGAFCDADSGDDCRPCIMDWLEGELEKEGAE